MGHPLDTVKVHLQTQDSRNPRYKGSVDCIRQLMVKEGFRGLYRGISSPLAGVAGINAVVFGIYGNTQRRFPDPDALTTHFLAGAAAGFFQSVLVSPMELAKLRVQVSSESIGPMQCIRNIYRNEGTVGIFRGMNITVLREVPAFASYFLTYEYLTRASEGGHVTTSKMLLAGGLAGVVSWTFTYPIDVIKSRVQFDGMSGKPRYAGAIDCLRKSVAFEGHGFLYRGLAPALVRAFPVNAAVFTVVTWTIRLCDTNFKLNWNLLMLPEVATA